MPRVVFIPLEPYPARYARHLPHAGKAFRFSLSRHPERSITVYVKSSSPEKKRSETKDLLAKPLRAICSQILRLMPRVAFILLEPYPARYARHLPQAGKAFRFSLSRHPERSITVYVKSSSPEKKRSETKDLLAKPLRAICSQILRLMPRVAFILLEPYPARYARHLPQAGKAFRFFPEPSS